MNPARDNAHQRQKKNKDRQLEDQTHPKDNAEKQRCVFADGDHGLELAAEMDKKSQRLRVHDSVAEVSAGCEQRDGRNHERHHVTLFVSIETGRDEHPNLVQDKGRGKKQSGEGGDLQVEVEGFGGVQVDQALRHAVSLSAPS